MRIMALDLGTKTIGAALSDATGLIARGLETIRRGPIESDFSRLTKIIADNEVDKIVIGYPKNMNGTIGEKAKFCEAFADKVKERFPALEVLLWDERLSTVAAEKVLISADLRRQKRKKIINIIITVVILQNY